MTCQDRRELLLLLAAGALDPAEEAPLRQHLATGCPACIGALAEAEATFHQLPRALSPEAAPESAWEKIETRIALKDQLEEPASQTAALAQPFTKPPRFYAWTGWAAAAIVAIALGLPLMNQSKEIANSRAEIARLSDMERISAQLADKILTLQTQIETIKHENETQLASYEKKMDKMMRSDIYSLASTEQPDSKGKLFMDPSDKTITLHAMSVKPAPEGKVYELWIIPPATLGAPSPAPIPAGTAMPDAQGTLVMNADMPPNTQLATAAVTLEPGPQGSQTPTMPIQFAANMTKQ